MVLLGGPLGEFIYDEQLSDDLDGVMDEETMLKHTGMIKIW